MSDNEEFDTTIGFADDALSLIKDNRTPAYPNCYEVWYSYVSGSNQELMDAVKTIYERYGRVSSTQIQDLYNNFFSKNPVGDKLDEMGQSFDNEVDNLLSILASTKDSKGLFDKVLNQASQDLSSPLDQTGLMKLIKRLALETNQIQRRNDDLEKQLLEARANIVNLKQHLDEVREESVMDQLTMIGNRKHFDRSLAQELEKCRKSGKPLSLIIADIDHFKRFNDTWGHQAGDQVLRLVAMAIKGNVKNQDIPCRYGGEEFTVILPETNTDQAVVIAERIRKTVSKREVVKRSTGENLGRITISAGVSTLRPNEMGADLLRRADLCLYAAKNAGRNTVIKENDPIMKDVA